jgi:MFS family permease
MRKRLAWTPFLTLCALGGFAIFSSTMSKNPALPLFTKSLGVSTSTIGLIAAASTVVGILVSLPAGVLSDVIGRKRVIMLAAFVFASAPFLYLLVHGPGALVLVRIYHGLATAILGPVAMAAVADTHDVGRGERMAWYSSATMVGRFLAPTAGGLLIIGQDFRLVFLGCGVAGIIALVASIVLPESAKVETAAKAKLSESWATIRTGLRQVVTSVPILVTASAEAGQYLAFGCVEVYLVLYAQGLGFSTVQIGTLFTAQVLITTLTKPALGRLSDRMGRNRFIVGGLLLDALTMAMMPWVRAYWLLMLLTSAFGLALATVTSSTSALVSDLAHQKAYGAALGTLSSIMDIGHASGPILGGLLVGNAGRYQMAFAIIAGILTAASVVFATVVREPAKAAVTEGNAAGG